MPRTNLTDTAQYLAQCHKQADPGTHTVYLATDPVGSEVRLVEVSSTAPDTDEVFAVYFDAQGDDVPYPSGVVLLSDQEWEKVKAGHLPLPEGWGGPNDLKKIA